MYIERANKSIFEKENKTKSLDLKKKKIRDMLSRTITGIKENKKSDIISGTRNLDHFVNI